jgi:carbamoyltransferase
MSRAADRYVLGINAYHADASAVLLRDGQLVAAVEEERFRRIKHCAGFPTLAIQKCLAIAGIGGDDVSHVAIGRDAKANAWRKAMFVLTGRPSLTHVLDRVRNARSVHDIREPLSRALSIRAEDLPRIHHVEHHPAHLASAFFVSPFDDAAVCAVDGFGDFVSTSSTVGAGNTLDTPRCVHFPHSLGVLYSAVTQHLGFLGFGDEFKVMGLAPYGKPTYVEQLRRLVTLKNGGRFELSLEYFRHASDRVEMEWDDGYPSIGRLYSSALEELLGPTRSSDEPLTTRHEDIARSLQTVYEEALYHVLNDLHERTGNPRLCLAGGCAMNSVANGKIRSRTGFRDLYIQPAASDKGTALGAAYYVWHQLLDKPRRFVMEHAYWGTEYPNAVAAPRVDGGDNDWSFASTTYGDDAALCRATAELIAEGNVVGWFQGRMEWGARALGNRSILADPRRPDIRDIINLKIKVREKFRPFAPAILEERLDEYFVDAIADPFMQQVYPLRPERRADVPAVTHVDGTGRLQTVGARSNPRFHRLIQAFDALTGVPMLLNTSFNENEPIVDTPEQALDCFLRTKMDAIVVGDTVIRRVPIAAIASLTASEAVHG